MVEVLGEFKDPKAHYDMLLHLCEIIKDKTLYNLYWQEISNIKYNKIYKPFLKKRCSFVHFVYYTIRLQVKKVFLSPKLKEKTSLISFERYNNMVLTNLIRNESHAATIIQALTNISDNQVTEYKKIKTELEQIMMKFY